MRTKLYKFQKDAVLAGRDRKYFHYDMDMGTGKTIVTLAEVEQFYNENKVWTAVVIAPKGMYYQWEQEARKHWDKATVDKAYFYTWGMLPNKRDAAALEGLFSAPKEQLKFIVVNTEALSTKRGQDMMKAIMKKLCVHRKTYLVVDEATDIKHRTSARTKVVVGYHGVYEYRRILSGSLGSNSPMEVYCPYKFLHPSIFPGNYFSFRARYAVLEDQFMGGGRSFKTIVGYRNLAELGARLARHSFQIRKDAHLSLPPKVFMEREVELSRDQLKFYKMMKQDFIIAVSDKQFVSAQLVLSQLNVLRQILCGFLVSQDIDTLTKDVHSIKGNPRLEALMASAAELRASKKAVIWAPFKYAVTDIQDALEKEYGKGSAIAYFGGNSDRQADLERWKKDPSCRWVVGTLAAGGRGLNMTEAEYMFHYTPEWDYDKLLQGQDRIHRVGQKNTCVYTTFVAKGTVDERILSIAKTKERTLNLLQSAKVAVKDYLAILEE